MAREAYSRRATRWDLPGATSESVDCQCAARRSRRPVRAWRRNCTCGRARTSSQRPLRSRAKSTPPNRRRMMRAAVMYGAGDVRVQDRPDPKIHNPTDAVDRVLMAAICGSYLCPYVSMHATDQGRPNDHELLGVIEEAGSLVYMQQAVD